MNNLKDVLKRGEYITTRSYGFPFHTYPYDFWRYEVEDSQKIFSDFKITKIVRDRESSRVFLKARKPTVQITFKA